MNRRTPIFYRILDSFFRHRFLFVTVFFVVTTVTMSVLYLRSKMYTATALTQVEPNDLASQVGIQQYTGWITPAQQNVNQFNDLMNNDQIGGFVDTALNEDVTAMSDLGNGIRKGALLPKLKTRITMDPDDERLSELRKRLGAFAQSDNLFAISLSWPDEDDCALIVERLQQHYIEFAGYERSAVTSGANAFLDKQIGIYERRMNAAQNALVLYKQTHAGHLPPDEDGDSSQLQSLRDQLQGLQITEQDAVVKKHNLQALIAQTSKFLTKDVIASQSAFEQKINEIRLNRDALVAQSFSPTHPRVKALDEAIARMQKEEAQKMAIHAPEAQQITQGTRELNPEYATLQEELAQATADDQAQALQMHNTSQQIAILQQRVKSFPTDEKALSEKIQNYQLDKDNWTKLVNQKASLMLASQVAQVEASSALQNISNVYAQPMTGRAKAIEMLIGSIVLGLIASILMVVLSEWADQSLRYEIDAERLLGVPVLALLPDASELRYLPAPPGSSGRGGRKALTQNTKPTKAALGAPAASSGGRNATAMNAAANENRPATEI